MLQSVKISFSMVALTLLTACGGGGGGSTPIVVSTETFNMTQAWVSYLTASQSLPFSIRGTVNGVSVAGSGTYSQSGLQASNFENQSVLRKSATASMRISGNGQSADLSVSTALYVDSNYRPVGSVGNEYGVVIDAVTMPATARVGDNGIWYTERMYPSSAKSYSTGTKRTSFVLEPDTASTALLKIIATDFSSGGSQTANSTIVFRMTPAGSLTRLKDTTANSDGTLTISY